MAIANLELAVGIVDSISSGLEKKEGVIESGLIGPNEINMSDEKEKPKVGRETNETEISMTQGDQQVRSITIGVNHPSGYSGRDHMFWRCCLTVESVMEEAV